MNVTKTEPLPDVPDLETVARRLSDLPLGTPEPAIAELSLILDSLAGKPPTADTYVELLEQSRTALCFLAEELARTYVGKTVPLGEADERRFQRVIDAWRKMASAYHQCALIESNDPRASKRQQVALSLQRSIAYMALCMAEHYRARREPPPGVWQALYATYALAEALGIDTDPVTDALDPRERSAHCASTLVGLMLTDLAGPYGLSTRDLGLVRRWADAWAPLVSIHPTERDEAPPPFTIDLAQDAAPAEPTAQPSAPSVRCLDLSRLDLLLRDLRHQLKHKAAPSDIGLGEDCTAGQCRRLLEHLSTAWSRHLHVPRKYRRRPSTGAAAVCSGFEAMHFFIAGKEFSPPDRTTMQTRSEYERLFAFPQMVESAHTLQLERERLGLSCEPWDVVNQSANGFRLRRAGPGAGIAHGQLLAVRPQDGSPFLLARANWLMQAHDAALIIGVEVFPGIPQAIAARPLTQTENRAEPFKRAFLLPENPALGTEPSLLLPAGWYRPFRIVEIVASASRKVELLHVLNDGPNFEHVSFAAAK